MKIGPDLPALPPSPSSQGPAASVPGSLFSPLTFVLPLLLLRLHPSLGRTEPPRGSGATATPEPPDLRAHFLVVLLSLTLLLARRCLNVATYAAVFGIYTNQQTNCKAVPKPAALNRMCRHAEGKGRVRGTTCVRSSVTLFTSVWRAVAILSTNQGLRHNGERYSRVHFSCGKRPVVRKSTNLCIW